MLSWVVERDEGGVGGSHLAFAKPEGMSLVPVCVTLQILAGLGPCCLPLLTAGVVHL